MIFIKERALSKWALVKYHGYASQLPAKISMIFDSSVLLWKNRCPSTWRFSSSSSEGQCKQSPPIYININRITFSQVEKKASQLKNKNLPLTPLHKRILTAILSRKWWLEDDFCFGKAGYFQVASSSRAPHLGKLQMSPGILRHAHQQTTWIAT